QMSAWYIFSAMGFYPVDPVSCKYILGAPQIKEVTLNLVGGKTFTVKAEGLSHKAKYVRAVYLNGEKLDRNYITHNEIMKGGELRFEMTKENITK
ncbi:MAG: glycoside hydrolase family 92 protein, partial [Alistipes sp.]|nr:glycoside hydrolase family 92 protein [Alistipes sp.]